MACGQVRKEFLDKRQNERRMKLIRVGDTANSGPAQGTADPLGKLVTKFYSCETEKIPTGRVALGYWLGCYRVGI